MFSDNEMAIDLLGFDDQVVDLCSIVSDPTMLPVTVGLLGDWGSGKSSLLKMAAERLRDAGSLVVEFSPWRIETYDDVKSAFLDAVVSAVEVALGPEEPEQDGKVKGLDWDRPSLGREPMTSRSELPSGFGLDMREPSSRDVELHDGRPAPGGRVPVLVRY